MDTTPRTTDAPQGHGPADRRPVPQRAAPGLAGELRDSLLLLALSLGVTVGLTVGVQALLAAVS